jgi:hypothetical protein
MHGMRQYHDNVHYLGYREVDDDLDAISAARAAVQRPRTVIPESKNGAVEALRVMRVARAPAVRERRSALQLLWMTIVSCPDELRDQVRKLTRMHCDAVGSDRIGRVRHVWTLRRKGADEL